MPCRPFQVKNGNVSINSQMSTATSTCNSGYVRKSGNLSIYCSSVTGKWSGSPLVCARKLLYKIEKGIINVTQKWHRY